MHEERCVMCPSLRLRLARNLGHQSHWYWLVGKVAEAPSLKESRGMSGVVKHANLGVDQHGVKACARC